MSVSEDFPIQVSQVGTVAIWTISRPERMNSLSRAAIRAIGSLAREAADNRSIKAIILTGAGEKVFCAGADLKERQGMSENDVRALLDLYRSEFAPLDQSPKPVCAAINGHALGGGLELALCCDLRVVAAHAELALPETTLGIIPGAGGTQRLPRIIGEGRAKELILTGRRVGAEEALAIGLVHRIASAGTSVVDAALALVAPIAAGAPIAQAAALAAIDAAGNLDLTQGLLVEKMAYDRTLISRDRREALAAFAEKRKPEFLGE